MNKVKRPSTCPACSSYVPINGVSARVCGGDCRRISPTEFADMRTVDWQCTNLHLHVYCNVCSFMWMEGVHDHGAVIRVW